MKANSCHHCAENSPVTSRLTQAEVLAVASRVRATQAPASSRTASPPPLSPRVSPLRHHWSPAGSSPSSACACPFLLRCFSARKTELAALVPSSSSGLCSNVNWAGPSDHPLWSQSLSATTVHWERSSLAPPQLDFALKHSLPSDVQYASFVHFRLLPLECVFVLFSFCSITVSSA